MSEQTTVYVVMGMTGEYSDRNEWPVVAFMDKAAAEARVTALDAWLREHRMHYDDNVRVPFEMRYADNDDGTRPRTPLDPNFGVDYTGTKYFIHEVPLEA